MSKLTSRERRASIVLIILGCGLILAMALIKGLSRPAPAEMPAIDTPVPADTAPARPTPAKLKSDTARTSRRRTTGRPQRAQSPEGRRRDYLSEPIPTR